MAEQYYVLPDGTLTRVSSTEPPYYETKSMEGLTWMVPTGVAIPANDKAYLSLALQATGRTDWLAPGNMRVTIPEAGYYMAMVSCGATEMSGGAVSIFTGIDIFDQNSAIVQQSHVMKPVTAQIAMNTSSLMGTFVFLAQKNYKFAHWVYVSAGSAETRHVGGSYQAWCSLVRLTYTTTGIPAPATP